MHHKRRSRRSSKKLYAACGCCIIGEARNPDPRKTPIEDGPCTGKARGKKRAAKKQSQRCIAGRHHEWYIEYVEEKRYWARERVVTIRVKTCINCWREKRHIVSTGDDVWSWEKYRASKPKRLPRRPVKF
jgi:hypothetical protein